MRFVTGRWLLLLVLLVASSALADIPINERVSLDGNLRFRGFLDERDFDFENTDAAYYATMRTMIGFKIQATDDVLFRVKLKDSRYVGVPYVEQIQGDDDATTVNTRNTSIVGLQEGYVFATDVFGTGLDFQLGRFEMEYGRGRVLGADSWNVEGPRTYDGFRMMWHEPGFQIDLFYSVLRDYSFGTLWPDYRPPSGWAAGVYRFSPANGYNDMKRYLGGIAASFADGAIQPLLLIDFDSYDITYEHEPGSLAPGQQPSSKEPELWVTPAVYTHFTFSEGGSSQWELEADAAGQIGQTNDDGAYPGSYNVASFLAAMDLTWQGNEGTRPFFGVGFDVTGRGEGDEDPRDVFVFYQDYYTQHRFRGLMDYFWNVNNGLIDGFITFGASPASWLDLRADVHNFRYMTSQGRRLANGSIEDLRQLGQEVDLVAGIKIKKGFKLDAVFSAFVPNEEFAMRVNRSALTPGKDYSEPFSYYTYLVFTTMF